MIVVVSEETGSISHAYKGQLVHGVTGEQLRAFLTSVLLKPGKPHNILQWLQLLQTQGARPNRQPVVARLETQNSHDSAAQYHFPQFLAGSFFPSALPATVIWMAIHYSIAQRVRLSTSPRQRAF